MYYPKKHSADQCIGLPWLEGNSPPSQQWSIPEQAPWMKFPLMGGSYTPVQRWKWSPPVLSSGNQCWEGVIPTRARDPIVFDHSEPSEGYKDGFSSLWKVTRKVTWHGPPILTDRARESISGLSGDPPWDVGVGRPPDNTVSLSRFYRDQGLLDRGRMKFGMKGSPDSSPPTLADRARESIPDSRGDPPRDVGSTILRTSSKAGTAMNNQVSGMCDEKKFSRRMQNVGFAYHLRTPSFSSLAGPGQVVETMDLQCLRWMMWCIKQQKEKPMERLCSDYSHRE